MVDADDAESPPLAASVPEPVAVAPQEAQINTLYKLHWKAVVEWLVHTKGVPLHEAPDAVQDAVCTALQKNMWSLVTRPEGWLRTVAWRKWLRSKQRGGYSAEVLVPDVAAAAVDGVPDLGLSVWEEREVWHERLAKLPEAQLNVVLLFVGGLTVTEIAAELTKPPRAISDLLYEARNQLDPDRTRPTPRQRRPHRGAAVDAGGER